MKRELPIKKSTHRMELSAFAPTGILEDWNGGTLGQEESMV